MKNSIDLFVPGRLCLMGEHSDWAGLYKTINADIVPGQAIVTGIEQGIYATVSKSDDFIVESSIAAYKNEVLHCPMDSEKLRQIANTGSFFSYVAGVASYVCENYSAGGIRVKITKMDLPIKSGLSSSAAICVLVARAFNVLYHLNLNTMGEMTIAYYGEQRTPSRCGRLDQACAYGINPVCMTFAGNEISVKPLKIKETLYFVIADLKGHKDTVKILSDLNKSFPFAASKSDKKVQEALGKDNAAFISKGIKYLEEGNLEGYGMIMNKYQKNFDTKIAPVCPDELTAPKLHEILSDNVLTQWIYGAKGVGSQGDGTVQFLAKNQECQSKIIEYLKKEKKMKGFSLTIHPKKAVRKAIVPVAGFGTRLFPVTKILKKDFFPVMDVDGILKPAILILLEQLIQAGIEQICLVVGEGEESIYESFFSPLPAEHYEKLSEDKKYYEDMLETLKNKITYVVQKERLGFGHAVYQCRKFTQNEPVLLLLGDMIYKSNQNKNCMEQMIDVYEKSGFPVISMHCVQKKDVVHYGIMSGQWENKEQTILRLNNICEKPTVEYAEDYLKVANKKNPENYYAVFGQYILTKEVFSQLELNIKNDVRERGEYQLTTALAQVREATGMLGFLVAGKSYDIGLPEKYIETVGLYCKNDF
ncbi:MAG: hypothetical protein K6E97_06445 [Treponema sp.]|nr:hypothetical protein [Treponema sp.]